MRQWLMNARHQIEKVAFGVMKVVDWWDEIITTPKRVYLDKRGEYKDIDVLIKSAMIKMHGKRRLF